MLARRVCSRARDALVGMDTQRENSRHAGRHAQVSHGVRWFRARCEKTAIRILILRASFGGLKGIIPLDNWLWRILRRF